MKPTLKPHNCASIWAGDGVIFCQLPWGDLSHTISVPNTVEGITKILNMLSARTEKSLIGQPGDPTQHHIDKPLTKVRKVGKQTFSVEQRESTIEVLRKLGMV